MKDRLFKIFLGLLLIFSFLYLVRSMNIFDKNSLEEILLILRDESRFGLLFTILATILMTFLVPISWFTALAAFFFRFKGFLYILAAGLGAASISFFIGKVFREDIMKYLARLYHRKDRSISLEQISQEIGKHGRGYVFFIRTMPFIPFGLANYASGFTSIAFQDYLMGTALGLGPGQLINTYFFVRVVDFKANPMGALLAGGLKILYLFLVLQWRKKSKYRTKD